jgi:hypothetical protein
LIAKSCQYASSLLLFAMLMATAIAVGQASAQSAQEGPQDSMVTIGPAAQLFPPRSSYHFPNGETYVYSVEWHMFNAGIARVSMDAIGSEQKVTAIADSLGVANLMYTVHDRYESYFDPRDFCSQRIVKRAEEGKRRRNSEIQFDYARRKAVRSDKDIKTGEDKRVESDIPGCVTDAVTGFYYLASQLLSSGSRFTFPVSDGPRTTEVTARVETSENVKVPAGTYQSLRLAAEPISGPLKGKAKVSVWFSDDAKHIPLQVRAKLGWGTLLFRLQRLETK